MTLHCFFSPWCGNILFFFPPRGTILTAAPANQTKRRTKIQKSQFYRVLPLVLLFLVHAVFPRFCCHSVPCRHPLAIRPYLQCLFSKFGRSERWEQALDLLSNPCSVTMAAQGDSRCQRPAPNLAGGIFSPLCHQLGFAGVSLHNCITQLSLVFLWFCLGDTARLSPGASLEGKGGTRKQRRKSPWPGDVLMSLILSLLEYRVPTNP